MFCTESTTVFKNLSGTSLTLVDGWCIRHVQQTHHVQQTPAQVEYQDPMTGQKNCCYRLWLYSCMTKPSPRRRCCCGQECMCGAATATNAPKSSKVCVAVTDWEDVWSECMVSPLFYRLVLEATRTSLSRTRTSESRETIVLLGEAHHALLSTKPRYGACCCTERCRLNHEGLNL